MTATKFKASLRLIAGLIVLVVVAATIIVEIIKYAA